MNCIEVEVHLPRRVAQEFEGANREIGEWARPRTRAGYPVPEKKTEGSARSSECKCFRSTKSYTAAEEGREEANEGEWVVWALQLTRINVV